MDLVAGSNMCWNEATPSLALSDIMHQMSPSPVPIDEQQTPTASTSHERRPRTEQELSPEPVMETDVLNIRMRLQEMGFEVALPTSGPGVAGSLSKSQSAMNNASSREKELLDMVLRLTSCLPVDPAQLERQATTISRLIAQRDHLVTQAQEERKRWLSERESWDRTAEALLTQKARPPKSEDLESQRLMYEGEIIALRDKLQDRNRRLTHLQQELIRLKPLLLMQPSSSRLRHSAGSHSHSKHHSEKDKGKRREVDSGTSKDQLGIISEEVDNNIPRSPPKPDQFVYPYGYQYNPQAPQASSSRMNVDPVPSMNPGPSGPIVPSSSEPVTVFEAHVPPSTSPPPHQRRSRDRPSHHKSHGKKHKYHGMAPISSDAYTEHVLLAAQRIGRKRAAIVTGIQQLADREKEALAREQGQLKAQKEQDRLEKERLERLASGASTMAYYRPTTESASPPRVSAKSAGLSNPPPRTPKRGGYPTFGVGPNNNANPGGVNTPPPSTYVFVNTSTTPLPRAPVMYSPSSTMNAPGHLGAPVNLASGSRSTAKNVQGNPPTPLDSLLDAARSMMDDGVPTAKANGRRRLLEEPESPVPKRRRVSSDKPPPSKPGPQLDRVRSALDVLADQAAAAEPDQSNRRSSTMPAGPITSSNKGKGKAKATNQGDSGPDARTRTSTRVVRPSSRRRGHSPDQSTSTSASTSGRGSRKSHQQKAVEASRSRHQRDGSEGGARVIARPPLAPSGSYMSAAPTTVAHVGLRPVVAWGNRPIPAQDDDDDDSDSEPSPVRRSVGRNSPQVQHPGPYVTSTEDAQASASFSVISQTPTELHGRPATPVLTLSRALEPVHSPEGSQTNGQERDESPAPLPPPTRKAPTKRPLKAPRRQSHEAPVIQSTPHAPPPNITIREPTPEAVQVQPPTKAPSAEPPSHEYIQFSMHSPSPSPIQAHSSAESPAPSASFQPLPTHDQTTLESRDIDMESPLDAVSHGNETDADEDQDAEGDKEDEEDAGTSGNHPSRSRSPPPDPPPPGPDKAPPDADDDADADAEGEMEFDEGEEPPPGGSTNSAAHQASFFLGPTSEEPPVNASISISETRRPVAASIPPTSLTTLNLESFKTPICLLLSDSVDQDCVAMSVYDSDMNSQNDPQYRISSWTPVPSFRKRCNFSQCAKLDEEERFCNVTDMQACDLSARLATTFAVTRWLLLKETPARVPFDHADRSSTPLAILLPFQPFLEVVWG